MAGPITERLGVKFTGSYAQGNEWELSLDNPEDQDEIESYRIYDDRDEIPGGRSIQGIDTDGDDQPDTFRLRRNYNYQKFNANGLVQFLATDATTISLNGGFSQLTAPVQSGIGTLQADGFGYAYGQLRVQSGGFFGQVFLNANDAGESYVYGSGDTVADNGLQWNGQLQYRFDVAPFETSIITGTDINLIEPRTEGRITGRNEGDDSINLYGAYAQTTSSLTEKFDLTLAFRGDYNNVQDQVNLSPRAALVFKANSQNTFRASYNRAVSAPGTNSNFLDIAAQSQGFGEIPNSGNPNDPNDPTDQYRLVFRGLGAVDGYTFDNFRNTNDVTFSLPTSVIPGFPLAEFFGEEQNLGNLAYLPALAVTAGGLQEQLAGIQSPDELPAGFDTVEQFRAFVQAAGAVAQAHGGSPQALAPGDAVLGIPDDSNLGYRTVDGPTDIAPLEQTTTQTVEVGYKGIFASKLLINIDAFYERKNDFIGPLLVESPLVYFDPAFLAGRIGELSTNPQVQGAIQQFASARGISFDEAVQQLAGAFGGTPTAVVQPDQAVLPGDGAGGERVDGAVDTDGDGIEDVVGAFLSYRNFGQVEYFGVDVSAEFRATEQLDVFANASYISDDFFDNEELDEADQDLSIALNAPQFKTRGGLRYRFDNGLGLNGAATYTEGFPVRSGPYVGDVQSYFLVDLGLTYDFQDTVPGLRLSVTAKNVLDNDHREFVGAPLLGRLILGRLTYKLPVGGL
jgi:iron complex outermembrane receptor protein